MTMSKHTTGIDAEAVVMLIVITALSGALVGFILGYSMGVIA